MDTATRKLFGLTEEQKSRVNQYQRRKLRLRAMSKINLTSPAVCFFVILAMRDFETSRWLKGDSLVKFVYDQSVSFADDSIDQLIEKNYILNWDVPNEFSDKLEKAWEYWESRCYGNDEAKWKQLIDPNGPIPEKYKIATLQ